MATGFRLPAGVEFLRPDRARLSLESIEDCLPEAVRREVGRLLGELPDPDSALESLSRWCDQGEAALEPISGGDPASQARLKAALTVFAHSNYLAETLIRHPELLGWSLDPELHERLLSAEEMRSEMGWIPPECDDAESARILARFKRTHLLRIGLRDLLGAADLAEVTLELSNLADAMLQGAHDHVAQQLGRRFGRPLVPAEDSALEGRFVVLALGKLGGRELNYSSDIDLMYLHTGDGETSGPVKIPNQQFYQQLATRLTSLLSHMTTEGFAYRVDLRLRPEGSAGELALALNSALGYYNARGRDWELQMLIKARPAAGDLRLGSRFLELVGPLTYRTTTDFSLIEKVSESRDRIRRSQTHRARDRIDVKLAHGGIRDIEFLVQCLQRLYGGGDPFVRHGGTLYSLERLHEKGYLALPDYRLLIEGYRYLRTLEHRLQLLDNRQTHELPTDAEELQTLERRMRALSGRSAGGSLSEQVRRHFGRVSEIYERVINSQRPSEAIESAVDVVERAAREEPPDDRWRKALGQAEGVSWELAEAVDALEIRRGSQALAKLCDKIVDSPKLLGAVSAQASLLGCVADLIEHSPYLGERLVRHPEDILQLAEAATQRISTAESESQLPQIDELDRAPHAQPLFDESAAYSDKAILLRRIYRVESLRILADSVYCGRPIFTTLARNSDLAEWTVRAAYRIAVEETARKTGRAAPTAPMQVAALGRLGMREFDLGSDADLVFVVPDEGFDDLGWWRDCVTRLIEVISSPTTAGMIFSVDTRLRPMGRDGELVQTESSYIDYFHKHAQAWEAMSYLKARTVAGDAAQGRRFLNRLQEVGWRRFGLSADLSRLLGDMRSKIETEQGRKNPLKAGAGGYYDVDFILLYLRLKSSGIFFEYLSTPQRIEMVRAAGGLDDEQADFLRRAATFFRSLDHAVRAATGQSSSRLPEEASLRETISELLVRWSAIKPHGRPLEALVDEVRGRTRELYRIVFSG